MNVVFHRTSDEDVILDFTFHPNVSSEKVYFTFKCVSFEKLLAESDFITLHVPFPKGSTPIIAKKELGMMKKSACIVNTARGGVVSEIDLIEALNDGTISYAALDVFEGEPIIKKELRENPNVSLSPHIGGSTRRG